MKMASSPARTTPQRQLAVGVLLLLTVAIGLGAEHAAKQKQLIAIDDLYLFDAPTDVTPAPDGKTAVYVRRWADRQQRKIRYSLWRVDGSPEKCEPLESGEPDARHPIFSPNGRWIVFLSTRAFPDGTPAFQVVPPYSDPATDIWLMPAAGGSAIPLAGKGKPYGRVFSDRFYGQVVFSPDGRRLLFVADDGKDPRSPQEIANNVRVVREDQGEGYEGYGKAQIWIAELAEDPTSTAASSVTRVTDDNYWWADPQWSADGTWLVACANRSDDRESVRYSINKNYDLWRIDLKDKHIDQLTSGPGPEVSPRCGPDGTRLLCLSVPRKGSHADVFNLQVIDFAPGGPRTNTLLDHHDPGIDPEKLSQLPPAFPLPRDCWLDEHHCYYVASKGTGSVRQIVDLRAPDQLAAIKSPVLDERNQARRRLTPPGNTFLRQRRIAETSLVQWTSFDGQQIEGALTLPPDGVANAPYKLLLFPHGGPHSRSSLGFNFTAQVFAAEGYAVFQPNFRGSTGYGQKFIDADRGDFGGGDMRDILTGIDRLVTDGLVDPDRQFVYGVSYGGFMTSWLIGQTSQFRAAAPQNAVTDLNAMWGLSDLQSWTEWEFGGLPWEVPAAMRAHSPLTYASRVRTPTLVLHSANDRRCPLPMGLMFYRALQRAGVETQMVIYPDEGHPIRQLPHQEDVLCRVLDWFKQHDPSSQP